MNIDSNESDFQKIWVLHVDKIVLDITSEFDLDSLKKFVSNEILFGLGRTHEGYSKDRRFRRRLCLESDFQRIEVFHGKTYFNKWIRCEIRITQGSKMHPVYFYPAHYAAIVKLEKFLESSGIDWTICQIEIAGDVRDQAEYERLFDSIMQKRNRRSDHYDYDEFVQGADPERKNRYLNKPDFHRREKWNRNQTVLYDKSLQRPEFQNVFRCESRLYDRKSLARLRIFHFADVLGRESELFSMQTDLWKLDREKIVRLRQRYRQAGTCQKFCRMTDAEIDDLMALTSHDALERLHSKFIDGRTGQKHLTKSRLRGYVSKKFGKNEQPKLFGPSTINKGSSITALAIPWNHRWNQTQLCKSDLDELQHILFSSIHWIWK